MNDVQDLYPGATPYVSGPITARVDLVNQPVAISFDDVTWLTATWTGTSVNNGNGTYTRRAHVLVDVNATFTEKGFYPVLCRVTDNPEIAVIRIGAVRVH